MAAHVMKGDRELCPDSGMDDYISKPMRARQLFHTIQAVLAAYDRLPPLPSSP